MHKTKNSFFILIVFFASYLINSCVVGPDYEKPEFVVPLKFKEESKDWKPAKPSDDMARGEWWKIFNDEKLNELENRLMISNQNIAAAKAQYENAKALIQGAKSGYFPAVNASASFTRSLNPSGSASLPSTIKNEYSAGLQASWEPIYGAVCKELFKQVKQAHKQVLHNLLSLNYRRKVLWHNIILV